jgi:hypothetical protein
MNQILKERFNNSIDAKISGLISYYESELYEFVELKGIRNEILNCLLLGLNQASIFTTNHLLERMIKVALIKNYTISFNYSQPEIYNQKIEESKKYDIMTLFDSLKEAFKELLITEAEMKNLTNLRTKMRNPYSHAEITKINQNAPKMFTGFMFNIEDVKTKLINNEPIEVPSPTHIDTFSPTFAQIYQEQNANHLAFDYFKNIYEILLEMENKLKVKRQAVS